MEALPAADQFTELFPALYRRFHRRVHHTVYQMTSESLAVVQHLADSGPLTVTEAARHMDRSQAAMSEILRRLTDRGVLARMPDDRDRRRILVWLTDEGRAALEQARSVLSVELLQSAMQQLPAADRDALLKGLQSLLQTNPQPKKDHES